MLIEPPRITVVHLTKVETFMLKGLQWPLSVLRVRLSLLQCAVHGNHVQGVEAGFTNKVVWVWQWKPKWHQKAAVLLSPVEN